MRDVPPEAPVIPAIFSSNLEPEEARLESQEVSKYLLAKSYFDCREYDRCAAVFLPLSVSHEPSSNTSPNITTRTPIKGGKGKGKDTSLGIGAGPVQPRNTLPKLSQKALFLALYAKYLSGEKRKDEESEMILGPADGGMTVNKELVGIQKSLDGWFMDRETKGKIVEGQGWLEYLYGIVLIKGKSEEEGKKWLIRSVHLCPFNWGAWLELSELLNNVENVCCTTHINTLS